MPDKTKLAAIREKLDAIAPLPEDGEVTAAQLARYMAVRAQERWTRMLSPQPPAPPFDHQQTAAMCAEYAAAHALTALNVADSEGATLVASQIRYAMEDGGSVGEWLWEILGEETAGQVARLTDELTAAQAPGTDDTSPSALLPGWAADHAACDAQTARLQARLCAIRAWGAANLPVTWLGELLEILDGEK
jgi:hypothetical protein